MIECSMLQLCVDTQKCLDSSAMDDQQLSAHTHWVDSACVTRDLSTKSAYLHELHLVGYMLPCLLNTKLTCQWCSYAIGLSNHSMLGISAMHISYVHQQWTLDCTSVENDLWLACQSEIAQQDCS